MAKTRTLPDKYYDKDYETNGIHRVPLWRIAGFALNNTATNLYLMFMNYVSFYLLGFVGVGMVMASSFTMAMRIWDGVTDPFIGYMVDKTNGKFGKNRPFMVIGNIILAASSFIMFHFTHKLPEGPARFIFFVVFCCVYYLGYTCQCVVTKSAQSCMTNDPKQRPMFASFDGVFNTILFTVLAIVVANIANKYADVGNYTSTQFFHEFWMMTAIMSAIFTVIAVISIAPKDRPEFFGTGKPIKVGLKDYWDTLKNNRAIQMLVLSASTDKLGSTAKTSAVSVAMFACIAGSIKLQGRRYHHPQRHSHLPGYLHRCHPLWPEKSHGHWLHRRHYLQRYPVRPVDCWRPHNNDQQPRNRCIELGPLPDHLCCVQHPVCRLPGYFRQYRNSHDRRLCRL